MTTRNGLVAALLAAAIGQAGCGGDDGDDGGGSIAGTYYGNLTIQHNQQAMSVVASTELVVASSGDLAGSSLTTISPTATVGETGTITGSLDVTGAAAADADFTIAFSTLGTFSASGTITWSESTGQVAGSIPTRSGGAIIGMTTFALTQE